ncbi:Single-stranded DNA-binding protein RIM1, mitochondrial [Lachnellula hyalina]|uniref:Single-stranded DNA-binding protein RIM1, mitochondrial n=1 Tax=Lachnellula hyalina TaxID=1316788 RepID=A0A8H8TX48_9HELO|nr:Single-stranded DNA-binding protein RIM1, mitochondrial [Lachnellula hyalina]TVY23557.1 Single-stranded DNA-binding protein RIM1, mitochondrial [Lachnellula hyalina]
MSSFLLRRVLPSSARAFSTSAPRSSFAKMTIIGRLADTPELQATSTGQEVLRYAVGTNSGPRDNQKTNWFRITSFLPEGPQRDFISSLDKGYVNAFSGGCENSGKGGFCLEEDGTLVYVEGDASMSQYTDADNKPRSSLNIVQSGYSLETCTAFLH